jgi:hypothetical protein
VPNNVLPGEALNASLNGTDSISLPIMQAFRTVTLMKTLKLLGVGPAPFIESINEQKTNIEK